MSIYISPNQYENYIQETGAELEDVIENWLVSPTITKDRKSVGLFHDVELIEDVKITKELEIRKIGENIKCLKSLIIDYDGGASINEIKEKFYEYKHWGYTSYNHNQNSHRFRIILPLKIPLYADFIRENRYKINRHYPLMDQSSFNVGRFFFLPCCAPDNVENYRCWKNDGELYSLPGKYPKVDNIFESKERTKLPENAPKFLKKLNEYNYKKDLLYWSDYTREQMDKVDVFCRGAGVVHDTLLRLCANLKHQGIDDEDIWEIMSEYAVNSSIEKEIRDIIFKRRS